jgi:hypothetical protein
VKIVDLGQGGLALRQTPPEASLRRFSFTHPLAGRGPSGSSGVAVSPDGRHIAFAGPGSDGKLWVQDLDQPQPSSSLQQRKKPSRQMALWLGAGTPQVRLLKALFESVSVLTV